MAPRNKRKRSVAFAASVDGIDDGANVSAISGETHDVPDTEINNDGASADGADAQDKEADADQEQWDLFREEQYEAVEQLPLSLHRTFALMRELDDQYTSHARELLPNLIEYVKLRESLAAPPSVSAPHSEGAPKISARKTKISIVSSNTNVSLPEVPDNSAVAGPSRIHRSASNPSRDSTRPILNQISWLCAELMRTSEEKLALATSAYNSVDRHVRSLDSVIRDHESALILGLRDGTHPATSVLHNIESQAGSHRIRPGKKGKSHKRKEKRDVAPDTALENATPFEFAVPPPTTAMTWVDLPVDPNEPTYCSCKRVSFGEMIECDGDACEIEWFHIGCVGLTEAPKNKWYCPNCVVERPPRKRKG